MRRMTVLLLGVAMILARSESRAQSDAFGYIGLFADGDHSTWCVSGTGFFPVEMWVWCHPGAGIWDDVRGAAFRIEYGEELIPSTATINPVFTIVLGTLSAGLECWHNEPCETDWLWCAHQTIYVRAGAQSIVELKPHPEWSYYSPHLILVSCMCSTCPAYPAREFTKLYINSCGPIGIEEVSWGSIKALYDNR